MSSKNKKARLAGILYLILIVCGILNLVYIPSQLIDWDSAPQTLDNIMASEWLFRLGVVFGIITFLAFLLLPLALYRLLEEVNRTYALLMVIFALISIPISFVNLLNKFSILTLIGEAEDAGLGAGPELAEQVMFYLRAYNNGIELSQVFWGLWLWPFGYLVFRSGFLPKVLGILLMAGCVGYLITFFAGFLYPEFYKTKFADLVGLPASIGEIGTCLWLLIAGARTFGFRK